jgi:hypothetical protein
VQRSITGDFEMSKSVVSGNRKSQPAQRIFRRRALKGPRSSPLVAVSLAVAFMSAPAGAACLSWQPCGNLQGPAHEASRKSQSWPRAKPKPKLAQAPAQTNPAPQPMLPEDAPHITPIVQGVPTQAQPAPQMAPMPPPNQPMLPEDAPHITPIIQGGPGATTVPTE